MAVSFVDMRLRPGQGRAHLARRGGPERSPVHCPILSSVRERAIRLLARHGRLMKSLADPDMSINALTRSIAIEAEVLVPARADIASCLAVRNSCNICERGTMATSRLV